MNQYHRVSATLATALLCASSFAHGKLEMSTPANGATLTAAPTELKFQFNEPVEAAVSAVKLVGPGDKETALEKPHAADGDAKTLVVAVPKLDAGAYRAQWATSGHDGHRVKGEIRFTVK